MQIPNLNAVCKYLKVDKSDDVLLLTLSLPSDFRSDPIQGKRMRSVTKWFRRFVQGTQGAQQLSATSAYVPNNVNVRRAIASLDKKLSASFEGYISSKLMRKILGITREEQARWLKDGRLPSISRQRVGSKSASFSVPVYTTEVVAMLESRPDIIKGWRKADMIHNGDALDGECD